MNFDLEIVIPCGTNSSKYLEFLVDSIVRTTSRFKLLIGIKNNCLDGCVVSSIKNKVKSVNFINVDCGLPASSKGHGLMLDKLCENLDCKYTCLVDCDCAFLYKKWFEFLSKDLINETICIGAEYDGKKYYNFPNAVFCLFKTSVFKSLNISFGIGGDHTVSNKDSAIFGRPIGSEIFLDVGWELPYKFINAGYRGITMPLISPRKEDTLDKLRFMQKDMRGEEYQYKSTPVVTHVGRSSSRNFDDSIVKRWRERVIEWENPTNT